MTAVRLRPVRHDDVPGLARLEQHIYGHDAWSEASWWGELAARPRRAYIVAERAGSGTVCGYAGLDLGLDVADIMTVTVAPEARRTGLGGRLMRWLIDTAAGCGAEHIMLEVRTDNEAALALYRRWDFQEISRRSGYYKGADALVLRRPLRPSPGGEAHATLPAAGASAPAGRAAAADSSSSCSRSSHEQ